MPPGCGKAADLDHPAPALGTTGAWRSLGQQCKVGEGTQPGAPGQSSQLLIGPSSRALCPPTPWPHYISNHAHTTPTMTTPPPTSQMHPSPATPHSAPTMPDPHSSHASQSSHTSCPQTPWPQSSSLAHLSLLPGLYPFTPGDPSCLYSALSSDRAPLTFGARWNWPRGGGLCAGAPPTMPRFLSQPDREE